MRCSGRHRSLGVGISFVRSMNMDGFVLKDVLMLLEGGNSQYSSFLSRQAIEGPIEKVYRTKAARYYRESLKSHVESLIEKGVQGWEGRVRRTSAAAKGGLMLVNNLEKHLKRKPQKL